MILSKVLQGVASDVVAIIGGKWGIKYSGEDLDAMADVATAAKNRSLKEFDAAVAKHGTRLAADILIQHHLDILYDQLLESNLMKIIEPFSCVEIARVAELIHLPLDKVSLVRSSIHPCRTSVRVLRAADAEAASHAAVL
eukprot:12024-Heterococcus_DN1.PRE.2